jgi:hypothetical protein
MAELVDALDLGSSTARCEGSSPFVRIDFNTETAFCAVDFSLVGYSACLTENTA